MTEWYHQAPLRSESRSSVVTIQPHNGGAGTHFTLRLVASRLSAGLLSLSLE